MKTIADVLRDRGLDIGRQYGEEHRAKCPVHGGGNPTSFSYRDSAWHCHACGEGGGVAGLVAALDGVSPSDASRTLRGGKRRARPAVDHRKDRLARRREALRRWRNRRATDAANRFGNAQADCHLVDAALGRTGDLRGESPVWGLAADLCPERDAAEALFDALSSKDEQTWAEAWIADQAGQVSWA